MLPHLPSRQDAFRKRCRLRWLLALTLGGCWSHAGVPNANTALAQDAALRLPRASMAEVVTDAGGTQRATLRLPPPSTIDRVSGEPVRPSAPERIPPPPAREIIPRPLPERLPAFRAAEAERDIAPATEPIPPFAGRLPQSPGQPAAMDQRLQAAEMAQAEAFQFHPLNDFSPTPIPLPFWEHDLCEEQRVYDDRFAVPVQRPLLELGRDFYGSGIRPPSETWLGETNLVHQQLYVYGDFRTGIAAGRNSAGRIDNWASRLNLDVDYSITATERFHMFVGPLNKAANNTNVALVDGDLEYNEFYNLIPVNGFFEGDLGAILGGRRGTSSPREMPFTVGLIPLVFQNGIWMEDAATGFAFAVPAQNSRWLNWSDYDASFFAIFDQLNSPAFGADEHAAQAFGTAWFIDAYDGHIEAGYAYLNDRKRLGRSYHNATISYTRRYLDRFSNSVRVITNSGQDLTKDQRTADGVMLLVENSYITSRPMNVIPYWNFFAGWGTPQSVARAGVSGGILRSTGLNFEPDGLNGHPTLDSTGADAYGGAVGIDLIGNHFDRQLILEAALVSPHGRRSVIGGDQYGLGARYQWAMTHNTIIRLDGMYGWQRNGEDQYGTRVEYRWKF